MDPINYCAGTCQVRPCCQGKDLKNCAYCSDYACQTLTELWQCQLDPRTKKRLDYIRKTL